MSWKVSNDRMGFPSTVDPVAPFAAPIPAVVAAADSPVIPIFRGYFWRTLPFLVVQQATEFSSTASQMCFSTIYVNFSPLKLHFSVFALCFQLLFIDFARTCVRFCFLFVLFCAFISSLTLFKQFSCLTLRYVRLLEMENCNFFKKGAPK